jgi:hypothetical protein
MAIFCQIFSACEIKSCFFGARCLSTYGFFYSVYSPGEGPVPFTYSAEGKLSGFY